MIQLSFFECRINNRTTTTYNNAIICFHNVNIEFGRKIGMVTYCDVLKLSMSHAQISMFDFSISCRSLNLCKWLMVVTITLLGTLTRHWTLSLLHETKHLESGWHSMFICILAPHIDINFSSR